MLFYEGGKKEPGCSHYLPGFVCGLLSSHLWLVEGILLIQDLITRVQVSLSLCVLRMGCICSVCSSACLCVSPFTARASLLSAGTAWHKDRWMLQKGWEFCLLQLVHSLVPWCTQNSYGCTALAWLLHQQGCTCLPKETQLGCSPGKQLLLLGVPCVHVMGTCRTRLLRGTACALGLLSSLVWLMPISFLLRMTQMCINDYCSGQNLPSLGSWNSHLWCLLQPLGPFPHMQTTSFFCFGFLLQLSFSKTLATGTGDRQVTHNGTGNLIWLGPFAFLLCCLHFMERAVHGWQEGEGSSAPVAGTWSFSWHRSSEVLLGGALTLSSPWRGRDRKGPGPRLVTFPAWQSAAPCELSAMEHGNISWARVLSWQELLEEGRWLSPPQQQPRLQVLYSWMRSENSNQRLYTNHAPLKYYKECRNRNWKKKEITPASINSFLYFLSLFFF